MKIINYKGHTFLSIQAEDFFVAYFNYIDYRGCIIEVTITMQNIGSKRIYIAQFTGTTTQYTGTLTEVMDRVITHHRNDEKKRE